MNGVMLLLGLLILVDIWATVIYAQRAEAAAKDAGEMCRDLMHHLAAPEDEDAQPRRRHL